MKVPINVYYIQKIDQAKNGKFIFQRDGYIVVTHRNDAAKVKIFTSYGQSGLKENSGTDIFGGSHSNTHLPLTSDMIGNSTIPR